MPSEGCLRCDATGVTLMDGHLCGHCHTMLFAEEEEMGALAVIAESDGDVDAVGAKLPSGKVVVETKEGDGIDLCEDADEFRETYETDDHVVIYG